MKTLLCTLLLLALSSTVVFARGDCVTKKGYLAGKTISNVVTANNLAKFKNYDSLQQMVDSGLVYILRDKVPVIVEEVNQQQEKMKITFRDVNLTVWTSIRAVECD